MGTHSSILAWKIPWTEEPRGLQGMGLKRAGPTEHEPTRLHSKVIDIFPHIQQVSNAILSYVDIQLSQHLLLKRLFISH